MTRVFSTLDEAKKWLVGETAKGIEMPSTPISIPGVMDLAKAEGVGMFQATPERLREALAAMKKCEAVGVTLADAVAYAIPRLRPLGAAKTVSEVSARVLERKEADGASEKHLKGMRSIFKKLNAVFGAREIHTVTKEEFEVWQSEQRVTPTTRISYARHAHILFAEAVESGWTATNPLAKVKRNSRKHGAVESWTAEALLRFLAAAVLHEPHTVAGIAIKAFAGLRTAEVLRLSWSCVDENKIGVPASISKTKTSRAVRMTDNLGLWAAAYRKSTGRVAPFKESGWHDALQRVAKHAGVTPPQNALRHTFGTLTYHADEDAENTSFKMGSAPETVREWYVSMMVKDELGRRWWQITPELAAAYNAGRFDAEKWEALP